MKQHATLILLLLPQLAFAAAGVADVADDDPNLFVVMMAMLLAFVVLMLIGLLVFALFVGGALLLAGMGIFSLSVISGWYHRSFVKGVSTFFRLSLVAMGLVGGVLFALVLHLLKVPLASYPSTWILVAVAGAAAGWVSFYFIKRLGKLLVDKFVARR
ncbi:hypothetical protein [Polluticoccus soli]|uniref:hypothetical protein n=1 Tax=Polluticoccus soli TaxID=3034150 RepID=UPI0023E29D45|nr:hypothetical protein [Flavipsychrobacter sp. JY13-12]